MNITRLTAAAAAVLAFAAQPAGAQQQKVTGPVATYWVSAATTSGMGAGMAGMMSGLGGGASNPYGGGSANPYAGMAAPSMGSVVGSALGGSVGGALGGMLGGGRRKAQAPAQPGRPAPAMRQDNYTHSLNLQLGSSQKPTAAPHAEHLVPAGLGAGPSLPLVTPQQAVRQETSQPYQWGEGQRPKGKMFIYWGCGEHAAAAPIVIDFAKIGPGMTPPNIPTITVNHASPPSPGKVATYGEWPNDRSNTTVPPEGSLVGAHTVRGNYSPEINFNLAPGQDFLAPLTITGQTASASGGTLVNWSPVPGTTGYFAQYMGSADGEQFVMWTSSMTASFMGQLMDYLPPAEARRLVAQRVVMSPQTTSCTVPSEVIQKAPMGMLMMIAYGDEVNAGDPPRPNDPKVAWNRKWDVKVRFKSTTSTMIGMPAMGG